MRIFILSLAVVAAFALGACASKSSSNTTSDSNAAGTAAAESAAPAASVAAATVAPAAGGVPAYPGATQSYSATSQGNSGTVMMTDDSFDKVYSWYQSHLPAGSEKAHVTAPVQSAVFTMGPDNDRTSISITTSGSKTAITIAHQKT